MSYRDASWGKASAGWLGALGLSYLTEWGWSSSLLAGALMSSSDDARVRSVGNGMLWGVGTASALLVAAAAGVAANWETVRKYIPMPVGGQRNAISEQNAPVAGTLAGPATYAGNYYYWKNWHEKQRQQNAVRG